MYTVIGGNRNRTFRVLWMLHELDVPFTHDPAGPRSEAVLAKSPLGKVPVLLEGDAVVTDSAAILTYLGDKHGLFTAPAGTLQRARQDAMTFRILDELDAVLWTAARHSFVLPEKMRVPAVKDSLKPEFARNVERLFAEFEGPYVMGDAFTIPDILLTHCGTWAINANFPDLPAAYTDYLSRTTARPAYVRTKET